MVQIELSEMDIALIQSVLVTPQIRAVVDLSNRIETQARAQVELAQSRQSEIAPEPAAEGMEA